MLTYQNGSNMTWDEQSEPHVNVDDLSLPQRQSIHQQTRIPPPTWIPSSWELSPPLPMEAMSMALAITLTYHHIHDMHYLTPTTQYEQLKAHVQTRFKLEQDIPFYMHFKVTQPPPRSALKYYISSQHDLDQYIRLLYKQHIQLERASNSLNNSASPSPSLTSNHTSLSSPPPSSITTYPSISTPAFPSNVVFTTQPQSSSSSTHDTSLWHDSHLSTLYITIHTDSMIPTITTTTQQHTLNIAQATAQAEQKLLKLLSNYYQPTLESDEIQMDSSSWSIISTSSSSSSSPSTTSPISPGSTNSMIPDTLSHISIPMTDAISEAMEQSRQEKLEQQKKKLLAQIDAQKLAIDPELKPADPISEEFFAILNNMAPPPIVTPHHPPRSDATSRKDELKTLQTMYQSLEKMNAGCTSEGKDIQMHDSDEDDSDHDGPTSRLERRRKRHRETDGQRYHKLTSLFEQLHALTKNYAMSHDNQQPEIPRRSSKPTSLIGKGNLLHEATRMISELNQQRAELEQKLRMKELQAKSVYRDEVNEHMYAIALAISLQSSESSSIYHAIMSAGVITSKYDMNGCMLESSFATISTLGYRPEQVIHRPITGPPMFEQAAPIPIDFLHLRLTSRDLAKQYLPPWSPAQFHGRDQIVEEHEILPSGSSPQQYPQHRHLEMEPWWKNWKCMLQPRPFILRRKTGRPSEYVEIVSLRQVVLDGHGEPQFFLSMSNRRFGVYVSESELAASSQPATATATSTCTVTSTCTSTSTA